ncbi:MAG: SMR family transporter [archaeon]
MDIIFMILAAASGLLFTGGDVFLKYWAVKPNPYHMAIAFVFYIIAGTVLAFSFKRKEIAVAVAVLICFNLITVAILGFTLFKETLGLKEIIGISLAIVTIIILNI